MTEPVNIYTLSRIREEYPFHIIKRHQSHQKSGSMTRYHEIESLRFLVNALVENGVSVAELDGFFFGYHIPRIGKEFDLLKFTETTCLNIELKSETVSSQQIRDQLHKNSYYLSHLGKEVMLFTVETNTMKCWTLNDGSLQESSLYELVCAVHAVYTDYITRIDDLFKASQYLISPLITPDRFIRNEYFLTPAQEQLKNKLMKNLSIPCHCIDGRSGTGKTLLLYDLAVTFARTHEVLLIHYGKLSDEHRQIMKAFEHLSICSSEEDLPELSAYDYVLIDEAHRITPALFDQVIQARTSIFSCDPDQILTVDEIKYDIVSRIRSVPSVKIYVLSEHIRINKELHTFILCMKNLRHIGEFAMNFPNVDVNYAVTTGEAQNMIEYYRSRGYVFINCIKSDDPDNPYAGLTQDFDPFHVIGQEFDRVVLLLDASFYYDEEGKLQGVPHPNYLYPNLFYQSITRVREQLSIVIVNAPDLFNQIIRILNQEIYGV